MARDETRVFGLPARNSGGDSVDAVKPARLSRSALHDDGDAPTTILSNAPSAWLDRRSNGKRIDLRFPAVVGKGSGANVRVPGNNAISRKHLRIEEHDGKFMVEDLGSTNGTCINGHAIVAHEIEQISDGDVIRLADEEFDFRVGQ